MCLGALESVDSRWFLEWQASGLQSPDRSEALEGI